MIRTILLKIIDPFYPLFKRILDIQTYRYAVCGSLNTGFDIFLFFIFYNFTLNKEVVHFGSLSVSAHISAFIMAFCITFPTGFFLLRTVVFNDSQARKRVQIIKYFSVVMMNLFLNYILLKLLVEYFGLYPTPSKIIITAVIVVGSYLAQKHFTFRNENQTIDRDTEEITADLKSKF